MISPDYQLVYNLSFKVDFKTNLTVIKKIESLGWVLIQNLDSKQIYKWWAKMTQTTYLTISSILYSGSMKYTYSFTSTIAYAVYGWQYVGIWIQSIQGTIAGEWTIKACKYYQSKLHRWLRFNRCYIHFLYWN